MATTNTPRPPRPPRPPMTPAELAAAPITPIPAYLTIKDIGHIMGLSRPCATAIMCEIGYTLPTLRERSGAAAEKRQWRCTRDALVAWVAERERQARGC